MTSTAVPTGNDATLVRAAAVGSLLPARILGRRSARRLESAAVIVPGTGSLDGYLGGLEAAGADFAGWDGVVTVLPPDGQADHRLAIADRYGQVYETTDTASAADLPDADSLREWFKFLATACPECGVLDDPTDRSWVP